MSKNTGRKAGSRTKPPKAKASKETPPPGAEEAKAPKKPTQPNSVMTGTGAPPMISAEDPRQKAAEKRQPIGIRPNTDNENTSARAMASGRGKSKGKTVLALVYRGLELLRSQNGHVKTPEYLELEKDLGFGPK